MRQTGLLSRKVIRQIQSDIVTMEALSRLGPSDMHSQSLMQESPAEEAKDEMFTEVLVEEKQVPLSVDIANFNKHKNHFSKSTADDEEINVRDLENML